MTSNRQHIAVGVDDEGLVWAGHFGVAPHYGIYDRSGALQDTRSNPYAVAQGKHHGNPQLIVDLLPECGVFIAHSMGRPQVLESLGIQVHITAEQEPYAALAVYLAETS